MDWTMIGALGEILGASGVIVTLAYLAKQVRQSNVAAQHEATRESLDLNDRFLAAIGRTPQIAGVFRRGLADAPDLTDDERVQVAALFLRMTLAWQRMYEFERDTPVGYGAAARLDIVGRPGYRRWFSQRADWLNEAFRAQLERDIAVSASYTPPLGPEAS